MSELDDRALIEEFKSVFRRISAEGITRALEELWMEDESVVSGKDFEWIYGEDSSEER